MKYNKKGIQLITLVFLLPNFLNAQTYTASGNFTVPASGVDSISVQCWGGGGGAARFYSGGGGGGGAYAATTFSSYYSNALTSGSSYVVTVGSGGTAPTPTFSIPTGGPGGTSSFGSTLVSASGGNGGQGSTGSMGATPGGAGGTASIGTIQHNGGAGTASSLTVSGSGGEAGSATSDGIAGGGAAGTSNGNGVAGATPGAGGSGGFSASNSVITSGGSGAAGQVVVTIFYTGTPLAMSLGSVSLQNSGAVNIIQWNTETEQANDYFTVQRSKNGNSFSDIEEVYAKGTPSNYSYTDENPYAGINYYRLIMTDVTGNKYYSKVVTAMTEINNVFSLSAYPTVASNSLTIKVSHIADKGTVQITDITGRVLLSKTMDVSNNTITVPVGALPNGMYVVKYNDYLHQGTTRIIKKN